MRAGEQTPAQWADASVTMSSVATIRENVIFDGPRSNSLYGDCTVCTGATLRSFDLRGTEIADADHPILPALCKSAIAPRFPSIGTVGSGQCT